MSDDTPPTRLYIEPSDLRNDHEFQKQFQSVRPKLENMLLWLQREQSFKFKDNYEEIGRRVSILDEVFGLMEKCSSTTIQAQKKQEIKPLNKKYQ